MVAKYSKPSKFLCDHTCKYMAQQERKKFLKKKIFFGHSGYKYVTLQFERTFGNEGIEVLEGFICRQFSFQHFSN
jgi:hypothetical protein